MDTKHPEIGKHRSHAAVSREVAIGAAIAQLSVPLRWIMILGARSGLSNREIANLAGVSLDVVKLLRGRGLALIQKGLPTQFP